MRSRKVNKKAQEEMVGFAMIIIIVAVIILVFLGISLNKPKTQAVESYEVESFVGALLQHTTACSMNSGVSYLDVEDLIVECEDEQFCWEGSSESNWISSCGVLNSTVESLVGGAWKAGEDRPVKGYWLNVTSSGKTILSLNSGNATQNYREGSQSGTRRGSSYSVELRIYY